MKISDLIEKKDERKKIGLAGRKSIKKYTGQVVKEQWFNLLEKSFKSICTPPFLVYFHTLKWQF